MKSPVDLLLTYDFPPMGGGIARWMAEIALRYPAGELIVSTGSMAESEAADRRYPNRVDRLAIPARRLKNLQGLVQWSRRVTTLVAEHQAGFLWCGNLRPAAYPAKWAHERSGIPYGIIVHGATCSPCALITSIPASSASRPRRCWEPPMCWWPKAGGPTTWPAMSCASLAWPSAPAGSG